MDLWHQECAPHRPRRERRALGWTCHSSLGDRPREHLDVLGENARVQGVVVIPADRVLVTAVAQYVVLALARPAKVSISM